MTEDGKMVVRPYEAADDETVVALWVQCGLTRPWNDPRQDIRWKLTVQPELFLVGTVGGQVVATVMAGYEGHRGWVNYLAVSPGHRRRGYGRQIMEEAERRLLALGCPKVNLQVRAGNSEALAFYERIGYKTENVVSMGKRMVSD